MNCTATLTIEWEDRKGEYVCGRDSGRQFEKAGDTEEVRALREEISDNCYEHFNDLVARGLSPEEAVVEIKESLKGIEEVIDEIIRSNDVAEKTADDFQRETQTSRKGIVLVKVPDSDETISVNTVRVGNDMDFGADGIGRVEFESSSVDLSVELSSDGAIHLIPVPDDGSIVVSARVEEGVLRITAEHSVREESTANNSVSGMIGELLKRAFSGVSIVTGSMMLRLLLPENAPEIGAQTKSGDISVSGIATPGLKLSSISGDMSITPEGKTGSCTLDTRSGDIHFEGTAATFSADSASGDISIRGDFETCCTRSRSGDVNANVTGEKLSFYTASGDIELRGRANSLEINSISGEIEASALFMEGAFSSTSGNITLRADDALRLRRVSVNTVSGDAIVHLPAELNARVSFTTVSGDSKNTHSSGTTGDALVNLRSVSGDLTVR